MEIERLRRERWTGVRIAQQLGLSAATVSRVLRRLHLNRIRDIEPKLSPNRYEHAAPGDLVHFDIKRLVRIQRPSHRVTGDRRDRVKGIGAEFLHVEIDDHSRLAFTAMYPDQKEASASHFLAAAKTWFERHGILTKRILTDNGPCYKARRFAHACASSASNIAAPGRIPHEPTARPSASSNPSSTNGPMPKPSRTQTKEPLPFRSGLTCTTDIDLTPASTNFHPSPESRSMTTTS